MTMTQSTPEPAAAHDGRDHFDFFHGRWAVRHRRLRRRLAGCSEWDTFGGTTIAMPLLGGLGNVDDNVIELPAELGGPYRAASLRCFDPQDRLWRIWWLDGRWPARLDTPVAGRFEGGVGRFFADETLDGRPIRVRFQWLDTGSASPRWEQAFSADGGASWETNWTMVFDRLA
jgi:hypothetical protein